MKYYQIEDDMNFPGRWMLGDLNLPEDYAWDDIDSKSLLHSIDWQISVIIPGIPLKVTFIDFDLLISTMDFIDLFDEKDIDFKEIKILSNDKIGANYFLISLKKSIDCIDKKKSIFKLWSKGNVIRPDLVGGYEYFNKIVIDKKKVDNSKIFRLKGYEVAMIVSEDVMTKCFNLKINGIKFTQV